MATEEIQLTWLPERTYNHKPKPAKGDKVVISASRRTDMVKWYAPELREILSHRYPPAKVHSLVLWTKFASAVLLPEMRQTLKGFDNLYIHLTVTGLGGTEVEPLAPVWEDTFRTLPDLIDFAGGPDHIKLRVDPIFRARRGERLYDNLSLLRKILARGAALGIKRYVTSFTCYYPKVQNRLTRAGFDVQAHSPEEKTEIWRELSSYSAKLGIALDACAVPGAPESSCIDAQVLAELHPLKLPCSSFQPRTRELCGCTHAIDVGGYYTKACYTGCLYCYANCARHPALPAGDSEA